MKKRRNVNDILVNTMTTKLFACVVKKRSNGQGKSYPDELIKSTPNFGKPFHGVDLHMMTLWIIGLGYTARKVIFLNVIFSEITSKHFKKGTDTAINFVTGRTGLIMSVTF